MVGPGHTLVNEFEGPFGFGSVAIRARSHPNGGMRVRYRAAMTWRPMALAIETERLILRLRDERDAAWYRELIAERGEDTPTLEEATTRLARFRDLTLETGIGPSRSLDVRKAT